MPEALSFTAEQRALIEAISSTYVEACPGAGKTQAIVQRFIERPGADSRRGVALLSFTNAAVDEARARCIGQPELLRAPNFAGTIDSFINRFIVGPLYVDGAGIAPSFRDTWRHVPGSTFGVKSVQGQFQLDWFQFDITGTASVDVKRVKYDRRFLINNLPGWAAAKVAAEASSRWKRNIARGVMDAAATRLHAAVYMADNAKRATLAKLLASRFSEVIVDEIQDCCEEDVQLLQLVLEAGVRLVIVGDPDQGIYGFRGASAAGVTGLRALVEIGQRLNGNFRSSPAICGAVDSLRSGLAVDQPVGPHATVTHAVQLVPYRTPAHARQRIAAVAGQCDIDQKSVVVLAYAGSKARSCAGAGAEQKSSDSKLIALAAAVHTIQDESVSARRRADELSHLERILQQLGEADARELGEREFLDTVGLSARAYRERTLRLAMALDRPFEVPPSVFKTQLAEQVSAQRQLGWSLTGVKTPKGDKWPDQPSGSEDCFAHSTVHGYKGLQAPGVALVIPERPAGVRDEEDGVSLWSADSAGEARNVLYVGASRAERLLMLVVHESRLDAVRATLDRDDVTYSVAEDGTTASASSVTPSET
jgi:DNA helicase-2/ATP-dependent DNA helicase PcrA